jgi:hypothetical protein
MDPAKLRGFLGQSPDAIALKERLALAGKWVALELYSPRTLPLRLIEAIGDSPADCIRMLRDRGLDPAGYEFVPLKAPVQWQ